MITEGLTAAVMRRQEQNTQPTWAKFWTGCAVRIAKSRRSLPKPCRAWPGKSYFRRITSRKCTGQYALLEAFASRTKYKLGSGASALISGDSRRKGLYPTLSYWEKPSATP